MSTVVKFIHDVGVFIVNPCYKNLMGREKKQLETSRIQFDKFMLFETLSDVTIKIKRTYRSH